MHARLWFLIQVFNQQEADPQSLFQYPQQDNDFPYSLQFQEYNLQEPSFGESAFTGLNGMQDANQQEGDYFINALLDADLISFGGLSSDTDTDTAQVAVSIYSSRSSELQISIPEYYQEHCNNINLILVQCLYMWYSPIDLWVFRWNETFELCWCFAPIKHVYFAAFLAL